MALGHAEIVQPAVIALQGNGAPEAGVRQAGTPVPPEHIMGLSQTAGPDQLGSSVIGDIGILPGVPGDRIQGGGKDEAQAVLPGAEHLFDRDAPGAVHIIEKSETAVVQEKLGLRIHALEDQVRAGAGELRLRNGEGTLKGNDLTGDLADGVFIHAVEGVGNDPMIQQRLEQRAGNGGFIAAAVLRAKGPGTAEILFHHDDIPPYGEFSRA